MKARLTLKTLTAEEIAKVTGGTLEVYGNGGTKNVSSVVYDSRDAEKDSLFCAIKGERTDGHRYIADVVAKGASVVLASEVPEEAKSAGDFCAVIVEDTVNALGILSGYYRDLSSAVIIGVTGSVGKTTTKDFVAAVCSESFNTMKTKGNHNNEIGLPMTLFSIQPDCEVAVLEMGMSDRGEISFMTKLAKPRYGIITNIGTSHIANLGSRENICEAKLEIAEGMKEDGVLLLNGDEPLLADKQDAVAPEVCYLGLYSKTADYKAINARQNTDGMIFDILGDGNAYVNVEIPALGRHNVYNALCAFKIGMLLGMDENSVRRGLLSFVSTDMRQKIYPVGDITVIEDCYNASPESMRAAIEVLVSKAQKDGVNPCALLGDMLELGESSRLLHDQLGQYAAQMKVQKLFCYGAMADCVAEAAIKKGVRAEHVYVCSDIGKPGVMAEMVKKAIEPGDVLLVKASRGVAAEKVLDALKASYENNRK